MKQKIDLQRQTLNDCLEKEKSTKNQYENMIKAFQDKNQRLEIQCSIMGVEAQEMKEKVRIAKQATKALETEKERWSSQEREMMKKMAELVHQLQ